MVSFLQLCQDTQSYFWKQALPCEIPELIPGWRVSCADFSRGTVLFDASDITKEFFRSVSVCFHKYRCGIPVSFVSLLCQRRLPVDKKLKLAFGSAALP